jgi:hypothetical protein
MRNQGKLTARKTVSTKTSSTGEQAVLVSTGKNVFMGKGAYAGVPKRVRLRKFGAIQGIWSRFIINLGYCDGTSYLWHLSVRCLCMHRDLKTRYSSIGSPRWLQKNIWIDIRRNKRCTEVLSRARYQRLNCVYGTCKAQDYDSERCCVRAQASGEDSVRIWIISIRWQGIHFQIAGNQASLVVPWMSLYRRIACFQIDFYAIMVLQMGRCILW